MATDDNATPAAAPGADTIWTIGHSTHSIGTFMDILAMYELETVADVRRHPGSRSHPQYGHEELGRSLHEGGLDYHWLPDLGGRRKAAVDSPNTVWRNASFRGYADYMSTPAFGHGLDQLLNLASQARTVLMCAEAVWWRCHRSMIADALCAQGITVLHIMDAQHAVNHPMTGPARIEKGRLTYAAPDS
jgi:uncharacterized protein (DUF488 family)